MRVALLLLLATVLGWAPLPLSALLFAATPAHASDERELRDDEIAETSRIPMYGQPETPRPAPFAAADSEFVKGVVADFHGDRRAASNSLWGNGEWYLKSGSLNLAMSRYNQAWLLDRSNYLPYWGFARVLLRKSETGQAVRLLEESWRLCRDFAPNTAVEAALASAYSLRAQVSTDTERAHHLALANQTFEECLKLDPDYADGWLQWARALYRAGEYRAAREKMERARSLGTELPASLMADLEKRLAEPR